MATAADARIVRPSIDELVTVVRAPAVALSAVSGDISNGAEGFYASDRRMLSRLVVTVDACSPEPLHAVGSTSDQAHFSGFLRHLGDPGADPTVVVERDRQVHAAALVERVSVVSYARNLVEGRLQVEVAADLAAMADVKAGAPALAEAARTVESGGFAWVADDGTTIRLRTDPAPERRERGRLEWAFQLDRGARFNVEIRVEISGDPHPPVVLPGADTSSAAEARQLIVRSGDERLDELVQQSMRDIDALTVRDPLEPQDRVLAAGAPWFLTLFGRDAIWAARMLLPLGTELAAGTLRALARRQGHRVDTATAEQPGRIMHEIRSTEHAHGSDSIRLPPLYYGTVDATALFILLLHDAWRWGMPAHEVEQLLPAAEQAANWLTNYALGPTGFVSYLDETGHGLANQGWKDRIDSIQFANGDFAKPPIALCEAQAYAVAAAAAAASLFESFGRSRADELREWSDALAKRFRNAFWVVDRLGDYPAIALDGEARRVDSITSNLGHLLGTGLLDENEERLVVDRLAAPDLDSGYGLRTMSSRAHGYNPFSYHCGSVWTHDTAIAISGLAASRVQGARAVAASLISGLIAAAPAFDHRMPELFAGIGRDASPQPLPYPAACRPQAWAATASVALVSALLGLDADIPNGTIHIDPMRPTPVRRLRVEGLMAGAAQFALTVDGSDLSVDVPASLRVVGPDLQ